MDLINIEVISSKATGYLSDGALADAKADAMRRYRKQRRVPKRFEVFVFQSGQVEEDGAVRIDVHVGTLVP